MPLALYPRHDGRESDFSSGKKTGNREGAAMTPKQTGADIYRKYHRSAFADKNWARRALAAAKDQVCREIEQGFFEEEAKLRLKEPNNKTAEVS
jgi:hypothetical protein